MAAPRGLPAAFRPDDRKYARRTNPAGSDARLGHRVIRWSAIRRAGRESDRARARRARTAIIWKAKRRCFGVANAGLSLAVATDSGTGSSNFAYDSLTPLGGFFALLNLEFAEIILGGVGSGLYGMLVFAIVTVFLAGLMVGRTPEYLGKKIERREVQFAMLAVLIFPCMILFATAVAVVVPAGTATLGNGGPHGFTEILYAFASGAANNGSAFAGLGPNVFYDVGTGLIMLGGRFLVMIPTLALAGCLAARPTNELAHAGNVSYGRRALRRATYRRHPSRRRDNVSSGRFARPDRRTLRARARRDVLDALARDCRAPHDRHEREATSGQRRERHGERRVDDRFSDTVSLEE